MKENCWKPHPVQEQFHQNLAYETLFGGTKGPGKTETLLMEGLKQVSKENYRALILRRTFPRLGEVIDRSFRYFPKLGAIYSGHDQKLQLPCWTFPSGAKYAFGHIQYERDKDNYQGKQFQYIGFDQVEEFTESQYLFIMAQNRTSDPSIVCYVRSTANPGGVGHAWVKRRWIDVLKPNEIKYFRRENDEDIECGKEDPRGVSRSFIPATVYDNPSLIDNDPGYIRRLEQLPEQDKQALLFGNWDVFKGQFFEMWRKVIHVRDKPIHKESVKFISLDYGWANPSSVGWWQVDFDGNLHRYRELYAKGLTYEALAYKIRELTPPEEAIEYCVADPAIWGDKPHHKDKIQGESGGETLGRIFSGWTNMMKADNNRITGWGRMRVLLTPVEDQFGNRSAKMSCGPCCKDSIRTIPTLIHDETRKEDLNTDGEDHAGDDWRYAAMSRPFMPVKQPQIKYGTEAYYEELEAHQKQRQEEMEEALR